MVWLCSARAARVAAAAIVLTSVSGCWSLNQWSGPSQDPFFSVADPVPAEWVEEAGDAELRPSPPFEPTDD